ncbi:MAG: hypothetical protein ABWY06_17760 [Pseudomonas sp.]|uniref:hypothetical protein n=1 Tax=Pseudomonas sp. TaxID=306 RepID=UPI0033994A8D
MATRQLHFDFSHLDPVLAYTFRHSLYAAPLQRHTAETRRNAMQSNPLLRLIPEQQLTHFVNAELPDAQVVLLYVTTPKRVGDRAFDHPVHLAIHIPDEGRERVRQASIQARGTRAVGLHPKLARYRPSPALVRQLLDDGVDPEFPPHIQTLQDATEAAIALLFHHGNLVNLNTANGGEIPAIIVEQCIQPAVTATYELPLAILGQGDAWLTATPVDGTTSLQPTATTLASVTGPLQKALLTSQNLPSLQGQQWNPSYGVTSAAYGGTSGPVLMEATLAGDSGGWVAKNVTQMNGLTVDPDSVVYSPPPTTPTWSATGLWSLNDTPSLTATIATQIAAGTVSLVIADPTNPQGALTGLLVPGSPDPDTQLTPFTVTLIPPPGVSTTATATATLSLNGGHSGLSFTVTVQSDSTQVSAALHSADGLLYELPLSNTTSTGSLSLQVTNYWLRHLSVGVQYLDVGGNVLAPQNWSDKIPAFLRGAFETDPNKPFAALVGPVTTVFGVPIPADPTTITVPVWDEVHTVRLLLGGLGRGTYDSAVCPIGITVTALAELVMPVFMLAVGTAITNSAPFKALMADTEVLFAVCAAGAFLVAGPTAAYIALAQDPAAATKGLAEQFGPMLLSPATSLGLWVAEQIVEGAAERATPFVDIALAVINGAVTAAQLSETIIEVLDSPFVYEADLSRSMDLQMTLYPDPRFNKFPDYHNSMQVTVVYDAGTTTPVFTQSLAPTTLSEPIPVSFTAVPAGGSLRVYACFYAANGWQSGQGITDWIPALPTNGVLTLDKVVVTTNEIPLSSASVYVHQEKIGMLDGVLGWIGAVGTPPTETVKTPSPFAAQGKEVLRFSTITTAQEPEMLGYAWQATGLDLPPDHNGAAPTNDALWTMQNISLLQNPADGYAAPAVGFTQVPGIAYNMTSGDGDNSNFFIDSSNPTFDVDANPSGGWHVRALPLTHAGPPPSFGVGDNASYGRFPAALDRYVYHPQGYVIGISFATDKLYRLPLASAPVADNQAPFALLSSGQGARDGLIYDPVGLAVALDGRILVLESGNQRVQAFDIYGNPVPYFANPAYDPSDPNSPTTLPTLALKNRGSSSYLDIAVESQGHIYVLSYTGDGSEPSMYQIDLYTPAGAFLVTTPDVAAARIVVNILRDLYTLNYELFLDATGRVQPSVSLWLPPPPAAGTQTPPAETRP